MPVTVDVPEHFLVSVRLPDGTKLEVDGRVGKIIEWLLAERARIESMPFGSVRFDIGQRAFQPEITRTFPRIDAPPWPGEL